MKKIILLTAIAWIALTLAAQHCGSCTSRTQAQTTNNSVQNPKSIIPGPKKAHWIDREHYVTYEWNKRPKIGTYILLVNVFDKDKKRVDNLILTADAYMPSMKGSHDTGDKAMKLNKKGQYVIPVYFMMLGDWEIELKFSKGNNRFANAYVKLDIK